jgi:hypothetical protein
MEKQLSFLKDERDASTIWHGLPLQVRLEIEGLFAEFIINVIISFFKEAGDDKE